MDERGGKRREGRAAQSVVVFGNIVMLMNYTVKGTSHGRTRGTPEEDLRVGAWKRDTEGDLGEQEEQQTDGGLGEQVGN